MAYSIKGNFIFNLLFYYYYFIIDINDEYGLVLMSFIKKGHNTMFTKMETFYVK